MVRFTYNKRGGFNMEQKANDILSIFYGNRVHYSDVIIYGGYQKLNLPDTWPEK